MTSIITSAFDVWNYLFAELTDERTRGWFLVGSPIPILTIMYLYYKIIKKIGPQYMASREAFNIDKVVQVYNIIQVILCGWLTFEGLRLTFSTYGYYKWHCQPMDTSLSPNARKIATITWMYYMIKVLDLFDTIFFVLRKKFNQVSFLHFYHHMGTLVMGYMGATYYPDGQCFIIVPLNCFIHCFMYAYYFLTNYKPQYKNKIWWKKYITQLQIVQFLIILLQVTKIILVPNCMYPKLPFFLMLPQVLLMLWLFCDFYYKSYIKQKV